MPPSPAVLLEQPKGLSPSSPPELRALDTPSLDADVRALGNALEGARHASSKEELRNAQKVAHDVMIRAEQYAFTEVANAVFHIEDALTAMADGELEANDATWRQVDAAYRAAGAACDDHSKRLS